MMPVPCPCCKASNEVGPACRRCKADLGLLFDLETERAALLDEARRFAVASRILESHSALDRASQLRTGADVKQLRAVLFLLARDFSSALQAYDDVVLRS